MQMNKIVQFALILTLAVLSPLVGDAFAQWRGYEWGHGPGMMGWFGPIMMVVFWIAVIVGIILLIRWLVISTRGAASGARSEDAAMEILKRRYARGEINKAEFEEKKKDLV
jgi:putative membrane protein